MLRILVMTVAVLGAAPWSYAQTKAAPAKPAQPAKPTPTQKAPPPSTTEPAIGIRGFVTFGRFLARAHDTFDAVLGSNAGPVFGGGATVLLPHGIYAEVSASRFRRDGERIFVGPNQEVFPLGIPLEVTLTPLELTGGWRYRHCPRPIKGRRAAVCQPEFIPYVGGGWSLYRYQETSDSASQDEDVDERFGGFHILGGAEYRVTRWIAVGGELAWSSIPDALGEAGASAAFDENDLGGTTFRVKISIGR